MNEPTLTLRVKQMLVRQLNLKRAPEDIGDDEALFGGDLDLDSIDVLEIVVGLEKDFGVRISDRTVGERVIRTPQTIAAFIVEEGGATAAGNA